MAVPETGRWLNTRVPFDLIKKIVLDNDVYTGECSNMVPGLREGLSKHNNKEAGQFTVFENERNVWEKEFNKLNLNLNYNWME